MNLFRRYLQGLVILALVTAFISPACKFISGKQGGFIEICGASGIERVAVADTAGLPFSSPPPASQQQDDHHKAQDQCSFCFAQSHQKPLHLASVDILPAMHMAAAPQSFHHVSYHESARYRSQSPRAPPLYIS